MDGPSSWHKLMQAYVVVAIGVLAIIVMFDAKTRRSQENRLALILGTRGCPKALNPRQLQKEVGSLAGDVKKVFKRGNKLVQKALGTSEGMCGDDHEGYRVHRQVRCDPATDITCGLLPADEVTEGYGVYDDTGCHGKAPGTRIQCNLPEGNDLNYYEGYGNGGYLSIAEKDDMDN